MSLAVSNVLEFIRATKSSFFRSATKDRQTARAKELICREEYTKQVYIYNDNRKHIFGDFMPKLCEKAEEIYRKQVGQFLFLDDNSLYFKRLLRSKTADAKRTRLINLHMNEKL